MFLRVWQTHTCIASRPDSNSFYLLFSLTLCVRFALRTSLHLASRFMFRLS